MNRDHIADGARVKSRVLVENVDLAWLWADERILTAAGYMVATCPGPEGPPGLFPHGRCLLIDAGNCPLADSADLIVFGFGLNRPQAQAILSALRDTHPDTPVCLDLPESEIAKNSDLARGSVQMPFAATPETFVATVKGALEDKP